MKIEKNEKFVLFENLRVGDAFKFIRDGGEIDDELHMKVITCGCIEDAPDLFAVSLKTGQETYVPEGEKVFACPNAKIIDT